MNINIKRNICQTMLYNELRFDRIRLNRIRLDYIVSRTAFCGTLLTSVGVGGWAGWSRTWGEEHFGNG